MLVMDVIASARVAGLDGAFVISTTTEETNMNLYPRIAVTALLTFGLATLEVSSAQASPAAAESVSQVESAVPGAR